MSSAESVSDLLSEPVVLDDIGPALPDRARSGPSASLALLLPAALVLGGLVYWPLVRTVHASVTDPRRGFVGLEHFRATLATDGAQAVFVRTLTWAVVVPAVVTVLGLVLAYVSRAASVGRVFLWIMVGPIALPLVVTGVAFRLVYDPDPGRGPASTVTATLARWLGRDPDTLPAWLGPELITFSVMSAFVWASVGLAVVVFRRALDQIPPELADAVRAHGGTEADVRRDAYWQPLLRRTVAIVFALVALATARTFDLILVMAPGSVLDEASVLAVRQWQTSSETTTGPSAALGTLWLGAVMIGVLAAAWWARQAWPAPRPASTWTGGGAPVTAASPSSRQAERGSIVGRARVAIPHVAAAAWLLPLIIVLVTSLSSPRDAAVDGWRHLSLGFGSYREVIGRGGLAGSIPITTLLAVVASGTITAIALLAAYSMAWWPRPGAQLASMVLLAGAVVPVQVIVGPATEVLDALGATDTIVGVGLVHIALGVPFAVLVLRNALSDLPPERAALKGPTQRGRLRAVANLVRMPEIVPSITAVFVFEFVQVYNDFAVGLLFGGPGVEPLGLVIYSQSQEFTTNSGPLAAGCVIASLIPLALVVAARRKVVAGLVSGAVR